MITAREALALPSARLSEEDATKVERLMEKIDSTVRSEFRRAPLRIPIPLEFLSPIVTAEVTQRCRRALWRVGWEQQVEISAITRKPEVRAHCLVLEPMLEAYEVSG